VVRTLLRVDSNSLAFVILSKAMDLLFAGGGKRRVPHP
jgi:hypothetical protein